MDYRITAAVYTLGCRVNQYESEAIAALLRSKGVDAATSDSPDEERGIYIVNTCAVTAESASKSRKLLRRLRRQNPRAVIAAVGCDAQLEAEALAMECGADIVAGSRGKLDAASRAADLAFFRAREKSAAAFSSMELSVNSVADSPANGSSNAAEFVAANAAADGSANGPANNPADAPSSSRSGGTPLILVRPADELPPDQTRIDGFGRTRAYIKIQDGCDGKCAYCIIPSLRGGVSSRTPDEIAAEVAALASSGVREVVLTGIETSAYEHDLPSLIERVSAADGIERVRLGSLDPSYLTPAVADRLVRLPKLMPHYHISLQSGSSRVLAAMRRRYNAGRAMENLEYLRMAIPGVKFTADILTCFPGETESEFVQTLEFARRADFYHMHVFTYSPRPGTEAALLPELDPAVRRERSETLLALDAELRLGHHRRAVLRGEPLEILFEQLEGEYLTGHTREFMEAAVPAGEAARGEIRFARPADAAERFIICKTL